MIWAVQLRDHLIDPNPLEPGDNGYDPNQPNHTFTSLEMPGPPESFCLDEIPQGTRSTALESNEVTFDITGGVNTDPKVLNSISVVGESNPFTAIWKPDRVSYNFQNPDALEQEMIENGVPGKNITEPGFDIALLEANIDRI